MSCEAQRDRTLAIATLTVWVVAYFAWTASWVIAPMGHSLDRALGRIPGAMMGAALCWATIRCSLERPGRDAEP